MLSWQVVEHGKPLQRIAFETPVPQGTEVLVRVTRSGVCHSDLHIWDGYFDLGGGRRFYVKERGCVPPFTLGHEPFGVVEKLGPKAKGVKVGQKRLVYPWIGCGKCAVCKAVQDNYCVSGSRFLGVNRAGTYSTHLLVPDAKYLIDTTGIGGSYGGSPQELKEVVGLAKKRKLKPQPIETGPASAANAALEDLKSGPVIGRVVLDFETVEA